MSHAHEATFPFTTSPMDRLAQARFNDPNQIVLGLKWDSKESVPGAPFSVPRALLREGHMHLRGRTRSGKTSLAIAPLIEQLLRPYDEKYVLPDGQRRESRL